MDTLNIRVSYFLFPTSCDVSRTHDDKKAKQLKPLDLQLLKWTNWNSNLVLLIEMLKLS